MSRSFLIILGSLCLAALAGFANYEVLSDPAVTITNEKGELPLLTYFIFLGIALTFATIVISIAELFSLLRNLAQMPGGKNDRR